MKTTVHKVKWGKYKVAVGGLVVGLVERSSKVVRFPRKGVARVGTWVIRRREGGKHRIVGGHFGTRREAVAALALKAGKAP